MQNDDDDEGDNMKNEWKHDKNKSAKIGIRRSSSSEIFFLSFSCYFFFLDFEWKLQAALALCKLKQSMNAQARTHKQGIKIENRKKKECKYIICVFCVYINI